MKHILKAKKRFLCLLLAGALAACLSPAALAAPDGVEVAPGYDYTRFKDAGITLNVYNWGEYISNGTDGSMDVVKEFENLTGIRVNYTTYDTNESLYAKLKSGGGNYDVIIPSDYMIGKMAAEGMLEELDPANIPNAALIGDAYRSKPFDPQNKYSVAYTWGLVCIVYNRTMVDEGDLEQGWGILWDEKYAGQVLMFNNSRDAFAIAGKLLGNSINPGSVQEIEQAAEKLKEQKSVVQSYVMDEVFDKMGGGEAALAPYYVGDGVTMMADNPDLAMFIPAEGTNIYTNSPNFALSARAGRFAAAVPAPASVPHARSGRTAPPAGSVPVPPARFSPGAAVRASLSFSAFLFFLPLLPFACPPPAPCMPFSMPCGVPSGSPRGWYLS